jgi:pyruvate/2-oxoglutarate/acetoin dehydrogenase E1 component
MGVYWAKNAANDFTDRVEIVDLRTINPIDFETIQNSGYVGCRIKAYCRSTIC